MSITTIPVRTPASVPAQAVPATVTSIEPAPALPLFVVATHKVRERSGPPPRAWVPYGAEHAWRAGTRRTLCGEWTAGWDVFWDRRFVTTSAAACRACIEASLPEEARHRLAPLAAAG